MRSFIVVVAALVCFTLFSCNNGDKTPDVSNIKVDLTTQRFEQDLFALDSINFAAKIDQLQAKYPSFGENYIYKVLSADPKWSVDSVNSYVYGFIQSYRPIYDSTKKLFTDFSPYEKEVKHALQFAKYYFPDYKLPNKLITFIGPLDGYGNIVTDDAIIVGLHHHLGKNFSLYQSELVQETYPSYISYNFESDFIAINSMKNLILNMFPEKLEDKPLVQQMVEKGKRLYLLSRFLPKTEEYKLIGYTEQQMKESYKNEQIIWSMFTQNNFLQISDENVTKNYIGESPKTQELGDESPGNIGSFSGWQIVKKYMSKNPKTTMPELMAMDPDALFTEAKYKP